MDKKQDTPDSAMKNPIDVSEKKETEKAVPSGSTQRNSGDEIDDAPRCEQKDDGNVPKQPAESGGIVVVKKLLGEELESNDLFKIMQDVIRTPLSGRNQAAEILILPLERSDLETLYVRINECKEVQEASTRAKKRKRRSAGRSETEEEPDLNTSDTQRRKTPALERFQNVKRMQDEDDWDSINYEGLADLFSINDNDNESEIDDSYMDENEGFRFPNPLQLLHILIWIWRAEQPKWFDFVYIFNFLEYWIPYKLNSIKPIDIWREIVYLYNYIRDVIVWGYRLLPFIAVGIWWFSQKYFDSFSTECGKIEGVRMHRFPTATHCVPKTCGYVAVDNILPSEQLSLLLDSFDEILRYTYNQPFESEFHPYSGYVFDNIISYLPYRHADFRGFPRKAENIAYKDLVHNMKQTIADYFKVDINSFLVQEEYLIRYEPSYPLRFATNDGLEAIATREFSYIAFMYLSVDLGDGEFKMYVNGKTRMIHPKPGRVVILTRDLIDSPHFAGLPYTGIWYILAIRFTCSPHFPTPDFDYTYSIDYLKDYKFVHSMRASDKFYN